MTQDQENALRAVARQCNEELKAAARKKPKPKFDDISRPILAKHYEKIKPLGIPFIRFVWTIGVLNGRFIER
ncbi:hypothetical protein M9M37_001851 [Escherichia coli]|uniref:hypothetical protein n=1 Tax=Escherichia coli TaxID=562 RepID=UPI0010D49320|nr:hypothetical protein [Escherichia coli]EJF8031388.1 hypothetical protein [Escherichia coli]MDF1396573.1 hypothetical protein [Escherichia coli]GDF32147.1 hypothetical protein HmCmsJML270_00777 [Escherichia coli]HAL6342315.1 hypothetical protein [Escherichia coli]HAX4872290.1 hypothetical protein [Escherichia coli]